MFKSQFTDPNNILRQSKIIIEEGTELNNRLHQRKQLKYQFFIFLNQKSGGKKAEEYLSMEAEQITFNLKDEEEKDKVYEVEVFIYNLTN